MLIENFLVLRCLLFLFSISRRTLKSETLADDMRRFLSLRASRKYPYLPKLMEPFKSYEEVHVLRFGL